MKKKISHSTIIAFALGLGVLLSGYALLTQTFVHAAEEEEQSDFEIIGELFQAIFEGADSEEIDPEAEEEIRRRMESGESLEGFDPDDPDTWGTGEEDGELDEDDRSSPSRSSRDNEDGERNNSTFNGHFCQCDPRWQTKNDTCMCNAGCGLNSIAGIMQHLGINETPIDVRNALESRGHWNCNVGLYAYNAINSDYFANKGLKTGPNISRGGLDLIKAKRFIDEGAVILCSSVSLYHVFFVSDVDVENRTITTHDSWKGCGTANAVPPPKRVSAPYNKASYCDKYAYPIMLE